MNKRQLTEVVFEALEHSFCVLRLTNKDVARDIVAAIWERTIPTRIGAHVSFGEEMRQLAKGILDYDKRNSGEPRRFLVLFGLEPTANERAVISALRGFAAFLDAMNPQGTSAGFTPEKLLELADLLET